MYETENALLFLPYVLKKFNIPFDSYETEIFKSGHINTTVKVTVKYRLSESEFVAQKINTFVFSDPVAVMHNIDLVTEHIAASLEKDGISPEGRVLEFLRQEDGTNYFFESRSNFWRIYKYIPDVVTYDFADDLDILKNAGAAFGEFQRRLCDFPMEKLKNTLPGFHDTPARMKKFFDSCEKDPYSRRAEISRETDLIRENEKLWSELSLIKAAGKIPLRVTHNDTKYNNILIDKATGEARCVIDLDTVIPGLCAFDFGDAVRFAANTAAEDEPDLSLVSLDLDKYAAFSEGFISSCRSFLSADEISSLSLGCVTMAFELASRFFEDYINGDVYFRTSRPKQNLDRGRNQLALALDMKNKLPAMRKINESFAYLTKEN